MGIGLAPGYTFFENSSFPVNISLPPLITMPLKFILSSFGSLALRAGVQFPVLNSNLKAINGNDNFAPIVSVGVADLLMRVPRGGITS